MRAKTETPGDESCAPLGQEVAPRILIIQEQVPGEKELSGCVFICPHCVAWSLLFLPLWYGIKKFRVQTWKNQRSWGFWSLSRGPVCHQSGDFMAKKNARWAKPIHIPSPHPTCSRLSIDYWTLWSLRRSLCEDGRDGKGGKDKTSFL